MILKGSQRAGARQLADHLTNLSDNDHVELHSIKGFIAEDLHGALQEVYAVSRATRATQFMFSLSLSPPKDALVTIADFENAIELAAEKLGLDNQPRVVIFHEKKARRHCHVVFSRIDADVMKAINLPFYKTRLTELSRELYLTHGWDMPKGLADKSFANPLNFTLQEWQIAQRAKRDPREIKAVLKKCWTHSDCADAFAQILKENGFWLARGDRRGFVALDYKGTVYSLSRWLGVTSKALGARLGDPVDHQSVVDAQATLMKSLSERAQHVIAELERRNAEAMRPLLDHHRRIIDRQREERAELEQKQLEQLSDLATRNASQHRKGLKGLWDWVTGRRRVAIRKYLEAHARVVSGQRAALELLQGKQLEERRRLERKIDKQRSHSTLLQSAIAEAIRNVSPLAALGRHGHTIPASIALSPTLEHDHF